MNNSKMYPVYMDGSSSGQDIGFSSRQQEFNSPTI